MFVEVVDQPPDPKQRRWLKWFGLQEAPPKPDSWIPIVLDAGHASSLSLTTEASSLVEALGAAGIEARQQSYDYNTWPDAEFGNWTEERVAVLVRNRDWERALRITIEFRRASDHAKETRSREVNAAGYDDALTRQALGADPTSET
jgi:hypothetical protein